MTRRWQPGTTGEVGGIQYRVVPGKKGPADLRMDWLVDGRWVAVPMSVGGVLADFFYDNEESLYPRSQGNQGGDKYLAYIRWSCRHGWEKAEAGLRAEKAKREQRPRLFGEDVA